MSEKKQAWREHEKASADIKVPEELEELERFGFYAGWDAALKEVLCVHKEAWDAGNPLSPNELSERLGAKR